MSTTATTDTKFCKECGKSIARKAVICPHCGCQVEETEQPKIVINNANQNQVGANPSYAPTKRQKDKWVAFLLCLLLGGLGAHKFYENNMGMGILYLFTGGLFGIGWIIDLILLLGKPNPYYV